MTKEEAKKIGATHYDISVFNKTIYFRYKKDVLQHLFRGRWLKAEQCRYVKPL